MANKDMTTKKLEDYNDVFADILNTLLFKKHYIDENLLVSTKIESIYKTDKTPYKEQRRDTLKDYIKTLNNISFVLSSYGIENQASFDKFMPVRLMGYDFGSYNDQITANKHIHPVITIVLNFSDHRWGKAKSLHDIMDIPNELKKYVSNYEIKVFDIAYLENDVINSFTSDFRAVARFFKNKRLGKDAFADDKVLNHVTEVLEMLKVFAKDKYYEDVIEQINEYKERKGDVTMCTVAQGLVNQGRAEGRAEGKNAIEEMERTLRESGVDENIIQAALKRAETKFQNAA